MIDKTAMIAKILDGTKHKIHITKGGLHKIECLEPLKDYVFHFGRLRGLDIRFELNMPAVPDIDDDIPFEYIVDSSTLVS